MFLLQIRVKNFDCGPLDLDLAAHNQICCYVQRIAYPSYIYIYIHTLLVALLAGDSHISPVRLDLAHGSGIRPYVKFRWHATGKAVGNCGEGGYVSLFFISFEI